MPTVAIAGKVKVTTPVASASFASKSTPFIDIATYAFSSVLTVKLVVPTGVAEPCETVKAVGTPI